MSKLDLQQQVGDLLVLASSDVMCLHFLSQDGPYDLRKYETKS